MSMTAELRSRIAVHEANEKRVLEEQTKTIVDNAVEGEITAAEALEQILGLGLTVLEAAEITQRIDDRLEMRRLRKELAEFDSLRAADFEEEARYMEAAKQLRAEQDAACKKLNDRYEPVRLRLLQVQPEKKIRRLQELQSKYTTDTWTASAETKIKALLKE
jgi:hypothetical protein